MTYYYTYDERHAPDMVPPCMICAWGSATWGRGSVGLPGMGSSSGSG